MDQTNFSTSLRLNYTISPNLSVQYYGQPFIARGNFTNYKLIDDAGSKIYSEKFTAIKNNQLSSIGDNYSIDYDLDGSTEADFGNPDFNFIQYRSNLVLRWEYIPGSEFFFVWSQGTTGAGNPRDGIYQSWQEEIFKKDKENIFLLKATYRFIL